MSATLRCERCPASAAILTRPHPLSKNFLPSPYTATAEEEERDQLEAWTAMDRGRVSPVFRELQRKRSSVDQGGGGHS